VLCDLEDVYVVLSAIATSIVSLGKAAVGCVLRGLPNIFRTGIYFVFDSDMVADSLEYAAVVPPSQESVLMSFRCYHLHRSSRPTKTDGEQKKPCCSARGCNYLGTSDPRCSFQVERETGAFLVSRYAPRSSSQRYSTTSYGLSILTLTLVIVWFLSLLRRGSGTWVKYGNVLIRCICSNYPHATLCVRETWLKMLKNLSRELEQFQGLDSPLAAE